MIKITVLSGPYAGRTRVMPSGINPSSIFMGFVRDSWDWRVDYTQATEMETFEWFRHELIARIVRALQSGRSVSFRGQEFRLRDPTDAAELELVGQMVEDVVVNSGLMVTVDRDDQSGLIIGTRGHVQ